MAGSESWAQWRLLTKSDFDEALGAWKRADAPPDTPDEAPSGNGRVYASDTALAGALRALGRHVEALGFEHGREGKIPRANSFRPYRLTLDGRLAAAIALRASEAFNLCEIDVFLTTELPGIEPLETTRAALLFAMSDAVKSGGSMALQFTRPCAPAGIPKHVRTIAAQAGVELRHSEKGTLSPDEIRELFLRFCGLPDEAQQRVREYARRRFFSIERVCQLVVAGIWPVDEATFMLLSCPCPEMTLGVGVDATHRLLAAQALVASKAAILSGIFGRALRYVAPVAEGSTIIERCEYLQIPQRTDPAHLAVRYGPIPVPITLRGWSPRGDETLTLPPRTEIVALLRPRGHEEIRVFLRQDLDQAHEAAQKREQTVALIYPADYLRLSDDERVEAQQAARRRGVIVLACPESVAGLEAEFWRRQRVGRTVRK